MNQPPERTRARLRWIVLALVTACALFTAVANLRFHPPGQHLIVEYVGIAAGLTLLAGFRSVGRFIDDIGRTRQVVLLVLLAATVTGQFLARSASTFPFVHFGMFSSSSSARQITVLRYLADRGDGQWRPLDWTPGISSLRHNRVYTLLNRYEPKADEEVLSREIPEPYLEVVESLIRIYNRNVPAKRCLRAVKLVRTTVTVDTPGALESVDEKLLWTWNADPGACQP